MRSAIYFSALLLGMVMGSRQGHGATFYVSPGGSDQNPGTQNLPWATPGYGSKHISGGDTLVILSGDYRMSAYYTDMITPPSGSAAAWTVVRGTGATRPRILGSHDLSAAILIAESSYIRIENLEICSDIDVPYSGGFRCGINGLGGIPDPGIHHILIRDLFVHHVEITGLCLPGNASDMEIRNTRISHSAYSCISSSSHEAGNGWVNVTLDSCYLGYAGHYYQGTEQPSGYDRPDGFGIEASAGPVYISNTLAEHNYGDGLDSKALRTVIRNCRVENNYGDGIKLWGGDSSKVVNTLIYGVGDGNPQPSPWVLLTLTSSLPSGSFELSNVTLHDGSPRMHYAATFQYQQNTPVTVLMRNCILSSAGHQVYSENSVNLIADHNLFYITGTGIQLAANGNTYTSQNIQGFGTGNFYADPLFDLPAWGSAGDYRPEPNSPCIDAGVSGSGIPSFDLEYHARSGLYDLGCYESPVNCRPPADLAVSAVTEHSARLTWTAVPGQTYRIRYRALPGTGYQYLVTQLNTVVLTNLSPSKSYICQVMNDCGTGQQFWTPVVTFTTTTPHLFVTSVKCHQVTLNWSGITGATCCRLQLRNLATGYVKTAILSVSPFILNGLDLNTAYLWQLEPNYGSGWSSPLQGGTFTTLPGTFIASQVTATTVKLKWTGFPGAVRCQVRYVWAAGNHWSTRLTTADSVVLTGLAPGTLYSWHVMPDYGQGWTAYIPYQPVFFSTLISKTEADPLTNDAMLTLYNLYLFPNPASENLLIAFNQLETGQYVVTLYDLEGRTVYQEKRQGYPGINRFSLTLYDFRKGTYLVSVQAGEMILRKKLIVQ